MRRIYCLLTIFLLLVTANSFAEKISIVYTGQTHASLYHCDCPKEPDGGIARRMTKLKELRRQNPNMLLVDSGGFFAGGVFDEHSQGLELDKARNEINLKALELMGYDAFAISDDEFNFGKSYLLNKIKESKIPFLSANVKLEGALPYIIKEIANTKIAVIGLTNEEVRVKSEALEVESPNSALIKTIQEAKKQGAKLILALSYLKEANNKQLISEVKDIDILISGGLVESNEIYAKIGETIFLRPAWQGRHLGKIDLEIENSKLKDFKVEDIRLSSEVTEAQEIAMMLPKCFSDSDCKSAGLSSHCNKPAKLDAFCSYDKPKEITLLIVKPKDLKILNQDKFIQFLKSVFPGIKEKFVNYESEAGKNWVSKTNSKLFPVYLLAKDADSEAGFKKLKNFLELKDNYYYISPQFSGGSVFIGRPPIPNKLDVFLGTKEKNLVGILSVLRDLKKKYPEQDINIYYLAIEENSAFYVPSNNIAEFEEDLRHLCVKKYYPDKFWDYASCRANAQDSSWWDNCSEPIGIETAVIKKCAFREEGVSLLRENISLNKELDIVGGPTLLVNNIEVFALINVPKLEELEKIIEQKN